MKVLANCSSSSRSVVSSGGRSYIGAEGVLLLLGIMLLPWFVDCPDVELLDEVRELLCVAAAFVMGGVVDTALKVGGLRGECCCCFACC